ncbi:hypothetical protein LCGC14_1586670 [marine sediment metagenome]|uniref:Uncharacterized protein n=1 Tax=marine sediment metagenome TaxID=412755 RepID=A0A0F9J1C9_9ZZZZ
MASVFTTEPTNDIPAGDVPSAVLRACVRRRRFSNFGQASRDGYPCCLIEPPAGAARSRKPVLFPWATNRDIGE